MPAFPKRGKAVCRIVEGTNSYRIMLRPSNRWHFVGSLLSSLWAVCLLAYAAAVRTLREARLGQVGNGRHRRKNSKQEMDMGLLRFVKSVGAKIFGATETAAAPPDQWEQEAGKHGRDVAQVEIKSEGDKVVLSDSDAATEEAEKIAPATGDPVGVATVQDNIASADKAPDSKFYTVQPSDTLWKIAEAEYGPGHGGEYHLIFAANKPLLSDPDKIYPGQVLRIPPLAD
jgi:LysM repeat protein